MHRLNYIKLNYKIIKKHIYQSLVNEVRFISLRYYTLSYLSSEIS